jgi:hypothetical protein
MRTYTPEMAAEVQRGGTSQAEQFASQAKWRTQLRPGAGAYPKMRDPVWACRPADLLSPPREPTPAPTYTIVLAAFEHTSPNKARNDTLHFIFNKLPAGPWSTHIYLHCQSPL